MIRLVFLGKFRGLAPDNLAAAMPHGIFTLGDLTKWIAHQVPDLGAALAATRTQLVLNQEFVRDLAHPLSDGDEVAFLPPMSGG